MAGNETPESEDFHLGKMVGEVMGRIAEQERLCELLEDIEIFYPGPDGQPVFLAMDWSDLRKEIRRES